MKSGSRAHDEQGFGYSAWVSFILNDFCGSRHSELKEVVDEEVKLAQVWRFQTRRAHAVKRVFLLAIMTHAVVDCSPLITLQRPLPSLQVLNSTFYSY